MLSGTPNSTKPSLLMTSRIAGIDGVRPACALGAWGWAIEAGGVGSRSASPRANQLIKVTPAASKTVDAIIGMRQPSGPRPVLVRVVWKDAMRANQSGG